MRVGIGYDCHPLIESRKLILGGVEVLFDKGLDGWSDADVLIHAIIDALLGAVSLGDIGIHFPSTDPKYKGISSVTLLSQVRDLIRAKGWRVGNIDATIVCERPQLSPFIPLMKRRISETLGMDEGQISLKATTSKGMGFVGRGEGIAAYAVALVEEVKI